MTHGNNRLESNSNSEMCSTAPKLQCSPFTWLKPSESTDPDRTGIPTVQPGSTDCLEPILSFTDEVEIINSCNQIITRTWRAEAAEDPSLFVTCIQTIQLIDETQPTIENVPENITRYTNSGSCLQSVSWPELNIFDNYVIDYIEITGTRNGVTSTIKNGNMFEEGVTTVTYTVVDFCANVTSVSFEVNIMCASCFIECPPNACLPVGSNVSPDSLGYATNFAGNVNCGEADFTFEDMMIETGCNGVSTSLRLWSAVFETMPNLEFTCAQRIELKAENELKIYNCPEDINVRNAFTPVYWEDPVALNGSEITYLTVSHQPGSFFPLGITKVTYTATDLCGNKTTCSFKVSVLNDDSLIGCQEDITTSCDGNGTATVDWIPPVYEGDCNECPRGEPISGFIYVGSLNGSNYYCSRYNYNYEQAKAAATKYGGHIASITSREENEYLASHIASATALIGLTDIAKEGTFVWDSGEEFIFEDWFTAQPNNADRNQDVVELMRSGEWNDIAADEKREFVLEIPCEFVTQLEGPEPGAVLDPGTHSVLYRIADGCGFEKYCAFDINVTPGITLSCVDDIFVEVSFLEDGAVITWEDLEYSSCCDNCTNSNNCIDLTLAAGLPSGSLFPRDETTTVIFRAEDSCDNSQLCMFNVTVGTKAGSKIHYIADEDFAIKEELSSNNINEENQGLKKRFFDKSFTEKKEDISLRQEEKLNFGNENLYPNPTNSFTTLDVPDYQNLTSISVFTINGKLISENHSNLNRQQIINTETWQSGLYFIRMTYNNLKINTLKLTVY